MLNLIANELDQMGFDTRIVNDKVEVPLNRYIFKDEIAIALQQAFEDCPFTINRTADGSFTVKPE